MTIVETDNGLIVIDPLVSRQTANAALELYRFNRGSALSVKAVIYTHSHVDQYGGVLGVVKPEDVGVEPGKSISMCPRVFSIMRSARTLLPVMRWVAVLPICTGCICSPMLRAR